jgi:hypothetical protein
MTVTKALLPTTGRGGALHCSADIYSKFVSAFTLPFPRCPGVPSFRSTVLQSEAEEPAASCQLHPAAG